MGRETLGTTAPDRRHASREACTRPVTGFEELPLRAAFVDHKVEPTVLVADEDGRPIVSLSVEEAQRFLLQFRAATLAAAGVHARREVSALMPRLPYAESG